VVLLAGSVGAALASRDGVGGSSSRSSAHQTVADHDAALSARPLADRSTLDLRPDTTRLFVIGLLWAVVAALVARTLTRAIEVGSRRAPPAVPERRRFDRGPPASLAFS
jgi:hypothetical protein